MLKLMIVDDEKRTRAGLRACIPWEECGIGEIREADDGSVALEIALTFEPDIILSDVRMPTMTGIELSRLVQEKLPRCKFIFISGYSDKEYLKAAIKLKAVSYIEKPIHVPELEECVRAVVETCFQENEKLRGEAEAAAKLQSSVELLQSDLAVQLAERAFDPDGFARLLAVSDVKLPFDDKYVSVLFQAPPECRERLDTAVREAYEVARLSSIAGRRDDRHLVTLVRLTPLADRQAIRQAALRAVRACEERIGPQAADTIAAGIGFVAEGLANVRGSALSAQLALEKARFLGTGLVSAQDDKPAASSEPLESWEEPFAEAIARSDESVFRLIEKLGRELRTQGVSADAARTLIYKLLLRLTREAGNLFLGRFLEDRKEEQLWRRASGAETLREMTALLDAETRELYAAMRDAGTKSRIVHETIRYIQQHYSNGDLTIGDIAHALGLTPAYLSMLFKRDTGRTINDYCNEYRIEQAKKLLADRQTKLLEVAAATGYNDAKYFAKSFKRMTGITPSEYRESFYK